MSNPYTQAGRHLRVTTMLGPDVLLLQRLTGREALSTPYLFTLDMLSTDAAIDAAALLRTVASVTLVLADGSERIIHGRLRRFVQLERVEGLTRYQAELVPWLWFLSLSHDCRVFQNQSVPDIVAAVFTELGFTDFTNRCTGTYPAREYCVQYRESNLAFVSRLLEDEGIYYFFDHTSDKHALILADAASAVRPCAGQPTARMGAQVAGTRDDPVVTSLVIEHVAQTGKVALTDFNYLTPTVSVAAQVAAEGAVEEMYDYPGGFGQRDDGDRYARVRLEEHEALRSVARGESNCRSFQPGCRFELTDHYRRDANRAYQFVSVEHEAGDNSYRSGQGEAVDYHNRFMAIPAGTPFRPPRTTARPVVHGSQTAVVVGKAGEEIWVDKHGRVKVQFHWDRLGNKDEKSSCWVRVATSWAGKNWGAIQIPRIGQEVVVDFLEGDPDQPIITGRVYNAEQAPPYTLPANQTQSGVKSRSSKRGTAEHFNELRFEDKKGSEEIYLHAEKNWLTMVENDNTLTVGNDETLTVKNDRTRLVENDETLTVKHDRTKTVDNDETITIGANRTASIGSDDELTVGANQKVDVGTDLTTTVGKNTTLESGQDVVLDAGKLINIIAGQSITIKANQEITLKTATASITLSASGISIEGTPKVEIKGTPQVSIQGAAMVQVQGAIVKIN